MIVEKSVETEKKRCPEEGSNIDTIIEKDFSSENRQSGTVVNDMK